MNEQAIAIFCICDEIVKSYGFYENPANKMTTVEVMTFAIISGLHYRADYRTTRLIVSHFALKMILRKWQNLF